MKRSSFLKTGALTAAALGVSGKFNLINAQGKPPAAIKPGRLKPGDKIGLVSPAGFISEEELNDSITNLSNLGFNPVAGKYALNRSGYLGGTDKERAEDLNSMFADKTIRGIVCTRGGYGAARMLPYLDYDIIKNNPKPLVGYSDITVLISALYAKTGLVSFHGPVGISTYNDYSVNHFRNVLMNPAPVYEMSNPPLAADEQSQIYTINTGKAEGILYGGNLSLVVSLIGTEYDTDTSGCIIYLEEVGEEPYRIDRMLTQMIQAGKFAKAAGVAIGVFSKCEPKPSQSGISNSFTLREVLSDRLYPLGIPVVYGLSFGHITNKFTIPTGIKARLNTEAATLTLLEPAVV